ncbi:hypothetical protein GGR54DRAFT_394171 [Hypoxylon sp. NC1633]|nr:hypothetical protein GGR54DRAFT_394171 [Hypoxylon sp. NC1633]
MEPAIDSRGLSVLNASPRLLQGPSLLHDLVAPSGRDGLPAIDYRSSGGDRDSISYSRLHTSASALAGQIVEMLNSLAPTNVPERLVIPVLIPQSPALYIGLLGILKAGAAFCPLNPATPRDRLKFILHDVGARLVLVDSELASEIPMDEDAYTILSIDQPLDLLEYGASQLVPYQVPKTNDLAYVMYTSGSTGTPKGVGISHLAVTQSFLAHDRHVPSFTRFLQFAAPTFDVSVFEIFFPLFRGSTLVCCNRAEMLTDLPGILRDMRIDACELTPSVAGSLLRKRSNAPDLRLLLTIGEMLTEPIIQEFGGDESEDSLLWGMYGPTEATIHCTLQPALSKQSSKNNIGFPLDTVSSFVIDCDASEFRVLPIGHVGELAVGGSQIATGYLNRPEQTSAAFVDTCSGRIYRTGDKARMLPDGTIECLGRISSGQIKLNGQRVELGEVEHALLRTPGCHAALAAVIANVLVAFAAVEEDLEPVETRGAIFSECRSWLPTFMIPAHIEVMSHFPRLPSGKVDKKTLIERYETATASRDSDADEILRDDLERRLCEIAEAILKSQITPTTRLSSVGLDSLAAIEYASTIRATGIAINPIDILDVSTVRELSCTIEGRNGTYPSNAATLSTDRHRSEQLDKLAKADSVIRSHLDGAERVEACSDLQEAMIAETLKDSRLYVNQTELRFPNHLSTKLIKSWFFDIAQRNDILRTGFTHDGDRLWRVIWKQFGEGQIEISDVVHPLERVEDVELFLRRPLKIEIIPGLKHHTVILTLHHSIYDGWTIDLLIEDLLLLARGESPVDRPQFIRVTQHLSAVSESEMIDSREYWAGKLRDILPTPLPNLRTVATPVSEILTMSKEIKVNPTMVKDFAFGASIGPQVIFQACLSWLWGAINGVDDTTIGSVSSGRTLPVAGIEKIMGPCVETLPLRTVFNRYTTIIELLQDIHVFNRETLKHGSLPLKEIKRAIPLTQKLFDVIFAYQETLASRRRGDDIIYEAWHKDAVEAKLLVEICPLGSHFSCQVTWHSEAFSESQVDTLIRHLDSLVDYFVNNSSSKLRSISKCFPVGSLSRYNEDPKHLQTHQSLSELVETVTLRCPTYDALCFASTINAPGVEAEVLSYQELNSRANQIARYLQQSGAIPGCIIVLCMEKSPLLYCTILGILKAGCAYLPILPSTPPQRIQLILEQARPLICLVDNSSPQHYFGQTYSCSTINLAHAPLDECSDSNLTLSRNPSSLAYVIYTSGTTGAPKGVSVTNANVLSNLECLSRIYPHQSSDRMLQVCSQAFDMSVFEIFFSWGNGMCLCSATNDTLFEDLENTVRSLGITHLNMTVTVASLLEPRRVPDVEFLVTAGEPMTDEVLEKWATRLWQGYGPSETTNICTVRKVSPGDSSQYLGWSLENTSSFVFAPGTAELVPLGCVGELCFGGDQVAAGYLAMPELTAGKFFQHHNYGRLYRSGDIGRMLPDGSLIILGRIDNQVKLRGLRIELQEIHAVVLRSGLARTCASLLVAINSASSQQLALFYAPVGQESSSFEIIAMEGLTRRTTVKIQEILRAALPDYMVPTFVVPISALPLTTSGKIDHNILRQSISDLSDRSLGLCSSIQDLDEDNLEWTGTEALISGAISEAIGVDRKAINRWASFAALGVDSISAMSLARKLQVIFRRRIPLSLVLSNPSIGRLASVIDKEDSPAATPLGERRAVLPDELVESVRKRFAEQGDKILEKVLPCTPLQEAMLSSSPSSNPKSYCNQTLFRLRAPSQLMKAHWNLMFERHSILRTVFIATEDVQHPMVQVVLKSSPPTWETFEADNSNFQDYVYKHRNSLQPAIDSFEPPLALALIFLEDSAQYLSFVCHHAIYDGVSIRNLLAEIEAASRHEQLPVPPSFESFIQETLPPAPGADGFWAEYLHSFSPCHFDKLTFSRDSDSNTVSANISARSFSFIKARLQELGASLLSLCQAAWAITLSLLQNTDDVCFGNVVSGRSIALDQIDTLVAPCFNTVPIRLNLSRTKILHEVMKGAQHLNTEIVPYQFTGLRHIQSSLLLSRLFDTVLILQPQADPLDENIWSIEQEYGAMDVPLVCEITPLKKLNVVTIQLHRDPSLVSFQTSHLILSIYQRIIDACLNHPSSHILSASELPTGWRNHIAQLSISRKPSSTATAITTSGPSNENWTGAEIKMRSILSRLAKCPEDKIGRHTSIYRYGLDSISAVQFAILLRRESYDISAVDVIENPTCAGIASLLQRQQKEAFHYDLESFQNAVSRDLNAITKDYEALLPCTPTQQGMISQFLSSDGVRYFNYASWTLGPGVSPRRVVEAWANLASRHQILRTGFLPVNHDDTSYAMVVYPPRSSPVPVSIHQPGSFDESEWRAEAVSESLKLLSAPPWRVAIVDQAADQCKMHLAMLHALYDAKSLHMLLHRLAGVLSGAAAEETVSPIQTALSIWLDPVHSGPTSETFWKGKVGDLVVNKFPTMTPLHIANHTGSSVSEMCGTSANRLRLAAAEAGVTIQAALQAAWTRVLSAYLGEPYVTFGIVLDGRTTKEEQDVIFPMITTLPVLARNAKSNTELLEDMMQYNSSLRRHERAPLSKIQHWLGRPESQLFDTILAYRPMIPTENRLPCELLDESVSLEYPVALEIVETASDRLEMILTHDGGILPMEQACIILRQFEAVLVNLLTFPRGFSDQLTHTPDLFSILPATHPQLPSPVELLHQLVERTAHRMPTGTALEFVYRLGNPIHRRRWTYRELDEMGNRVANMLASCNTPPGSIVATCFDKSPEAYFSILGVLKAGCAFLSLDPTAPVSRLEFIVRDSNATRLLIGPGLNELQKINSTIPTYIVHEHELSDFPETFQVPTQASPSDICYCLYTSGTTGTPKGCLITHDNAVQAMLAFKQLFSGHWDARSRWLQFASFHFDVSVLEQYWSWLVGITVVTAPKDVILSDITAAISSLFITHIDLTPSLARLLHPDEVPSLCRGVFITGGEQLRREILQVWGSKGVIYNAYGPTEATIGVTMFQRVPANGRPSNIGTQFPNVGAYVFEPGTEDAVLRGGVGELCVSGRLVGRGYLNRQDLTEERFPVLKQHGERVYRTGDLVRILHDGSFDFLGRADDQVKLRGQRLEIGEINHVIRTGLAHQVADVATFVTKHLGQDRDLLVSFLAPTASSLLPPILQICSDRHFLDISRAALQACRDSLPGYMVPTYILCVPFVPLSANNKADTKRLKQLFAELPHDRLRILTTGLAGTNRALNEEEQLVAQAVSVVTHVEETEIHPSSSLFELGIDSINVARLAIILQSRGFVLSSPSLILRHPHISLLSQALQQAIPTAHDRSALQIKQAIRAYFHRHIRMVCKTLQVDREDVEYIAPCTPLQEGMVTRSMNTETQSTYFNQFQIDLATHVSVNRLRGCFDEIFQQCAILRTAFLPTIDGYVQVAVKKNVVPWFEIELKNAEVDNFISERREQWVFSNRETLRYPMEIDHFQHRGNQVLLIRLFHGIYDGQSFELLLRGVNSKYHRESPCSSPAFIDVLPHGPLLKYDQFRSFWEASFLHHRFEPMPALSRELGTSDVAVSRVFYPNGLDVRRVALGATQQTVLQAAWLATLHRRLGFVPTIGIVFSGRSLVFDGVEHVVGPMFNTLPFRVELSDRTTWAALVHRVQEFNASALECVHTPLRDIQKWCSKGQPLFDTLLTFDRQDTFPPVEAKPFWSSIHSVGTLDYPLALEIILLRDQSLKFNAVASKKIATEAALTSLLDEFKCTLEALAASGDDTPVPTFFTKGHSIDITPRGACVVKSRAPHPENTDRSKLFQRSDARKVRREVASLAGLPDEDIQETTSLFELGLDSVDAIKLVTRLKKLGFHITVSKLMKSPTIQSIILSRSTGIANGNDDHTGMTFLNNSTSLLRNHLIQSGMDLRNAAAVLPPTPLQDSMIADMIQSDFHRYFNHDVLEIAVDTDMDRLKSAWETVYAHSPILRTGFAEVDDPGCKTAFCQIVQETPFEFSSTMELSSLDEISMVISRARHKAAAAHGMSHLFQLTFVTTPTNRYIVISVAHALYDGWSLELLHEDVHAAYESRYHQRDEYEPYLSRVLFGTPITGDTFWADYLNDARPTMVNPRIELLINDKKGVYRSELISKLDPRGLKAICQRYRITPQILAQGCWAPVLASIANSLDVIFGVVLSGRDTDEAQGLLFPTMNTVPLRVVLHGTVAEYFDYLRATMSDIMEFQHTPLREVRKAAKCKGASLFNTLFLLQNSRENQVTPDRSILKSVHTSSAIEYPVCIEMEITKDSVTWHIAVDKEYMSLECANRTLSNIEAVLHHFAGDHVNTLEFDHASDRVSVCGLAPFDLRSSIEDGIEPTSGVSSTREIDSASLKSPIIDVLSELSGIEKHAIDLNHSIYHLGLDSISAIKASAMLRKRGLDVSVRAMLKAASIREISHLPDAHALHAPTQVISFLRGANLDSLLKSAGVNQAEVEMVLPALPMQVHTLSVWKNTQRLLFFPQFTYKLSSNASHETISKAWSTLVAMTPMLRTNFASTGSLEMPFIQIVMKSKVANSANYGRFDLGQGRWAYEGSTTPFAFVRIEYSPLEGMCMHLHIHHAIYDGISLPIMMGRFLELLDNDSTPVPSTGQLRWYEFASNHYYPEVRQQRREFWSTYLRGITPLRLLTQHTSIPEDQKMRQRSQLRKNAIESVSALKTASSAHGTTLQAVFFAAYSKALSNTHHAHKSSETTDVVFGVYLANRANYGGLEEAPFPTLSIVPLVVKQPSTRAIMDLAIEIQQSLFEISSFENASVGLWEIYDWTGLQIENCVNFLTTHGSSTDTYLTKRSITMTQMPGEPPSTPESNGRARGLAHPSASFAPPDEVRKAFLHTIDVEVRVDGDAMNIGIFCPSSFSESRVNSLMNCIISTLKTIH